MQSEHMVPVINPISNWIFSSNPTDIVLTMANGQILFEKINGQESYKTIDIEHVKQAAQKAIEDMMTASDYKPATKW